MGTYENMLDIMVYKSLHWPGLIIEDCVEEQNARGRTRMEYIQQIIED